jgi:hypothetical protein
VIKAASWDGTVWQRGTDVCKCGMTEGGWIQEDTTVDRMDGEVMGRIGVWELDGTTDTEESSNVDGW